MHLDVALRLTDEGAKSCHRKVEVRPILAPPDEDH